MVFSDIQMEPCIEEAGAKANKVARAMRPGETDQSTLGNIWMVQNTAKEHTPGRTNLSILVNGTITSYMV